MMRCTVTGGASSRELQLAQLCAGRKGANQECDQAAVHGAWMEGLDLTAFPRGLWKAEHSIEGPRECNGIGEEECQEPYVG